MTKEDRSHNRAPPVGPKRNSRGSVLQEADSKSPIPLGLVSLLNANSTDLSLQASLSSPVYGHPSDTSRALTGVGLTGGVIMGVMSMRWYKNGPTEDTMFGAMRASSDIPLLLVHWLNVIQWDLPIWQWLLARK